MPRIPAPHPAVTRLIAIAARLVRGELIAPTYRLEQERFAEAHRQLGLDIKQAADELRERIRELERGRATSDPGEDLYQAERRFIEATTGQAARRSER